jgi:hypothetical protein
MTSLDEIKKIITEFTPMEWASMQLEVEKENCTLTTLNTSTGKVSSTQVDYYEYMAKTWHNKDKPPITECIENSLVAKLEYFSRLVALYTGFVKTGRLFVLNKKERFVSFYFAKGHPGQNDGFSNLYVHYNPLGIDVVEETIFNKHLSRDYYEISTDEEALITKCDSLINQANEK